MSSIVTIKSIYKCKLLTGTYILQGNRAAFNQYTVDATCKLCHTAPETWQHFLAECSAYAPERETYLRNWEIAQFSLGYDDDDDL